MFAEKEFLTLAEVAQHLRISRSKLYADQRTGNLPVLRFGRLIRIRREDLERYVQRAGGLKKPGELPGKQQLRRS